MAKIDELITQITAYCRAENIEESTFGLRVVNDGKFFGRISSGGQITLPTLARVEAALAAPWSSQPPSACNQT